MSKEFLSSKDIIIDTNVLLEYFYLILEAKREGQINRNENQLIRYSSLFSGKNLHIVPQNLSDLYSLLKRDSKGKDSNLKYLLKELLPYLEILKETYILKDEILNETKFLDFGITDIALSKVLNKGDKVLISKDWGFIKYCRSKGFIACHPEEIFTF